MAAVGSYVATASIRFGPHWDGRKAADIFLPCGTPARACFSGWAVPADYPLGGATVTVTAPDGMAAYYAHLEYEGRVSGWVEAGDVIGYVSNTGNANKRRDGVCHDDESHIHFAVGEIQSDGSGTLDPAEFFAALEGGGGGPVPGDPFPGPGSEPDPGADPQPPDGGEGGGGSGDSPGVVLSTLAVERVTKALHRIWGVKAVLEDSGRRSLSRAQKDALGRELLQAVIVIKGELGIA